MRDFDAAFIRWGTRAGFIALLCFEIANKLGVLHATVFYTWLGLIVTLLVVWFGLEALEHAFRKYLKHDLHWSIWPLTFALVAVDAAGDIFGWYGRWEWYDRILHFTTPVIMMVVLLRLLPHVTAARDWRLPYSLQLICAHGIVVTIGTLYEVEEYLEDLLFHTNRFGDAMDTGNDLFLNFCGASVVALMAWWTYRVRRRKPLV